MPTATETVQDEKARLWAAADAGGDIVASVEAGSPSPVEADPTISNVKPDAVDTTTSAPTAEAQDDLYKGLPETVQHELAGLRAQLAKSNERLRNTEGHIGGLKTQLKQLSDQAQVKSAEGPTAAELKKAQGSASAMARLLEDYPDLGESFKGALEEAVRPLQEQLKGLTSKEPAHGITPDDLKTMRAELTVEARHPNWQERVRTPQFVGWLQGQAREVQMLAASDSPQDAIRLLDLHSEVGKSAVQQKNQRLSSAAAMPSGRASAQRAKPVENMSKEELWAYLDSSEK